MRQQFTQDQFADLVTYNGDMQRTKSVGLAVRLRAVRKQTFAALTTMR